MIWAVLEQVFTGHQGSAGAGVYWPSVQCLSRCSLVIRAMLEQVFIGHLCSVGAGVRWPSFIEVEV